MFTTHCIKSVAQFHRKHGVPIGVGTSELILRQSLIYEEASEVFLAIHDLDELDLVDGLGDLLYVAAGAWVSVIGDKKFPDEDTVGLSKRYPVFSTEFIRSVQFRVNHIVQHSANLGGSGHYDWIIYDAILLLQEAGYDAEGVFDEIHASNMTKAVSTDLRVRVKGPDYRAPDLTRFLRGTLPLERDMDEFLQQVKMAIEMQMAVTCEVSGDGTLVVTTEDHVYHLSVDEQ